MVLKTHTHTYIFIKIYFIQQAYIFNKVLNFKIRSLKLRSTLKQHQTIKVLSIVLQSFGSQWFIFYRIKIASKKNQLCTYFYFGKSTVKIFILEFVENFHLFDKSSLSGKQFPLHDVAKTNKITAYISPYHFTK